MTRFAKWPLLVGLLGAVAVLGVLAGCNGDAQNDRPRAPKAQAYLCEACGYGFGVPMNVPLKERLFPPMVCPKCKERTAVRATFYIPKDGGKPVLYKLTKYTDEQVKKMETYRDAIEEEHQGEQDPEGILAELGESAMEKYPDQDKWFSPGKNPNLVKPFSEIRAKFKHIIPMFPEDWPVVPRDELKQR